MAVTGISPQGKSSLSVWFVGRIRGLVRSLAAFQVAGRRETRSVNACDQGEVIRCRRSLKSRNPFTNHPRATEDALAAEEHPAEFITQAVGRFRIPLVAETLRQGKKLLLLSLLCVNSALDQFHQHAVLAQLSTRGHATHLLRQSGGQTHTLANRFLSHLNNITMHQNGVQEI